MSESQVVRSGLLRGEHGVERLVGVHVLHHHAVLEETLPLLAVSEGQQAADETHGGLAHHARLSQLGQRKQQ